MSTNCGMRSQTNVWTRSAADYGNTILKSSARNQYMIERTRRILRRTVWALQEQLRNGEFQPEGFEVSIGGGRIDRLDVLKDRQQSLRKDH